MTTEHQHRFTMMPIPRVELGDGTHTAFYVLFCDCRHAEIFPRQNFSLLSPELQAHWRTILHVEHGLELQA